MPKHEQLLQDAKDAIDEVFCDKTVNPAKTLESMEELEDLVKSSIDALRSDLGAD